VKFGTDVTPRASGIAAALTAILLVWYGILFASSPSSGISARTNVRVERTERFGADADGVRHGAAEAGHTLQLSARGNQVATAHWNVSTYEFQKLLPKTRSCRLTFYTSGVDIAGSVHGGSLGISLNGKSMADIGFSKHHASLYPISLLGGVPESFAVRELQVSPLAHTYAVELPVTGNHCTDSDWSIRLTVRNADWRVATIGIIATFVPNSTPLFGTYLVDGLIAFLELAAFGLATFGLLRRSVCGGLWPAVAAMLAMTLAPLTHDQWDFAIWLRFVDLTAFAHANPAGMWQGTPLWAFMPSMLSPVATTASALFGNASEDAIAVVLKGAMAAALLFTAWTIADMSRPPLRRFVFLSVLLSPIALYELAGGYREVFAGAFLAEGLRRAYAGRLLPATLFFVAAASVTEILLPYILFTAAFAAADGKTVRRRYGAALLLSLSGVAGIVCQWVALIPHDLAAKGFSNRIVSYRFGGGSWFGALDGLGLLPDWIRIHSVLVVIGALASLAVWPALIAFRTILCNFNDTSSQERMSRVILSLTFAFCLSYRGLDPNTWYALFIAVLCYFVRYEPLNAYPATLAFVFGLSFYAIAGLADFVNWTFLWPADRGLFGLLGSPVDIFVLTANALMLVGYITLNLRRFDTLFSPRSNVFLALFLAASANAAVYSYPVDLVFSIGVTILFGATFVRLSRSIPRRRGALQGFIRVVALALCIIFGSLAGDNGAARLTAILGTLVAASRAMGLVDAVLLCAAVALLDVQPGIGWVSIAGWITFSLLAIAALREVFSAVSGYEEDGPRLHA